MKSLMFRFRLWAFQWISDKDGDLGLKLFGLIAFIKYKEMTIVYYPWNKWDFNKADKWQGHKTNLLD